MPIPPKSVKPSPGLFHSLMWDIACVCVRARVCVGVCALAHSWAQSCLTLCDPVDCVGMCVCTCAHTLVRSVMPNSL